MYTLSPNCVQMKAVILLSVFENVLFNLLVYSFWCQKTHLAAAVLWHTVGRTFFIIYLQAEFVSGNPG